MIQKSTSIRKSLISRVLTPPKTNVSLFWPREMKLAKDLMETYRNDEFWEKVNFGIPLNSLAFLKSPKGQDLLKRKFNEFNYVVPETKQEIPLSSGKFGEDVYNGVKSSKTLKDLLS